MTAKAVPIPVDQVESFWHIALPFVDSFLERAGGRWVREDILEHCQSGDWQLWVVIDENIIEAVCITVIIDYSQRTKVRDMRIIMMVGDGYKDWVGLIVKLEDFARSCGCKKITGEARPGWEKVITPMGYKKTHIYLEKDL